MKKHNNRFLSLISARHLLFQWLVTVMTCVVPAYPLDTPDFFLVVGETQSLKPFDNPNKTFQDPLLVATLKITEVLRGSDNLVGKTFEAYTSDVPIYGNTCAITPALKKSRDLYLCHFTERKSGVDDVFTRAISSGR